MTYEKALLILGLNENFTEEDLKKVHRKLAQEHHPDRHEKSEDRIKEEEIMKDINSAKDYLMKYLKKTNQNNQTYSNTNQSYTYTINYIHKKLNDLKNIVDFKEKLSPNINKINQEIYGLYIEFSLQMYMMNIDILYDEYLNKIKEKFKELEIEFYKENYIDKTDIKENINYDCTLKEFYEQLLNFKDKYSKEILLKKKIQEEIIKYTYFSGYETIEFQIKDIIQKFVNKIKNKGFKYSKKDIDDIHKEITKLFNEYFSLKQKIEDLEKTVKTIDNEEIKTQYDLVERNFYSGIPFDSIQKGISELEELIDKYQKEYQIKEKFKENEEAINDIYKQLISRYSEVAQNYNIVTTPDAIKKLNEFLNEIIRLFQEGCKERKELDYFNLFNEINFNNIESDTNITKIIISRLKENKYKIYVKKKESFNDFGDERSFFLFDEEKMLMYKIKLGIVDYVEQKKIDYRELKEDYILIDELFSKSSFINGYRLDSLMGQVLDIYEADGYILSYNYKNNKFYITTGNTHFRTEYKEQNKHDEFQNKDYVYSLIEKQLKEKIDEQNKFDQIRDEYFPEFIEIDINNINKKDLKKIL